MTDRRVLAVQSHVVHGYVGNKAATFPLQLNGWDVDALNAVQFSNHTGYGEIAGYKLDGDQIKDIYNGLKAQDFEYDAMLTGYLPSAEAVKSVAEIAADLKSRYPSCFWLLDPVMGDEGTFYVKQNVIPEYKAIYESKLVDLTTPNHFEVEVLTGFKLTSLENVSKALDYFHDVYKVPYVVISSLPHSTQDDKLLTVGSTRGGERFIIEQNKLDSYFTGTGDLFAALLLTNFSDSNSSSLAKATALTVTQVSKVLKSTLEYAKLMNSERAIIKTKSMKFHELRLIQCAPVYTSNEILFNWKKI